MHAASQDQWTPDVSKVVVGWLPGTVLAIVLVSTVVKWYVMGVL